MPGLSCPQRKAEVPVTVPPRGAQRGVAEGRWRGLLAWVVGLLLVGWNGSAGAEVDGGLARTADAGPASSAALVLPAAPPHEPDPATALKARWLSRPQGLPAARALRDAIAAHAKDHPTDAAAWVWLAQAHYWEGLQQHDAGEDDDAQMATYGRAVEAARTAQRVDANHPGGWFWDGVNTAKVAELRGVARSVNLLPSLRSVMDRTDALAPGYFYGGTWRFRGVVITRTPSMLVRLQGSSLEEADRFFARAQKHGPTFAATRRFLAELRLRQERPNEARALLQKVLDEPPEPDLEERAWNSHERLLCRRLLADLDKP